MIPNSDIQFDEAQYSSLIRELKNRTGVSLEGYRPKVAQRRLSRRMRRMGCGSTADYLAYIRKNPEEANEILSFVTISVGRFFRNKEIFNKIESVVLPEIFDSAKPCDKITIWSAGCGEGEEIYSIAMILLYRFPNEINTYKIRLIASDINTASLEKARAGRYDASRTIEMNPWIKTRFMHKVGNLWEVNDEIKKTVEFRMEVLPSGKGAPNSDLILFRNLLIYFDREHQDALLNKVVSCLKRGGFLALGKSETLPLKLKKEFDTVSGYNRIYRKALS